MADYIDFIEMTTRKPELGNEFIETLKSASPAELSIWLKNKGFTTTIEECVKIMESKKEILGCSPAVPMDTY